MNKTDKAYIDGFYDGKKAQLVDIQTSLFGSLGTICELDYLEDMIIRHDTQGHGSDCLCPVFAKRII